jgi:hypothetical protein
MARTKRKSAAEAREADARMEHFLRCLRYQRIYEAAVRARLRTEYRSDNPANGS